MPESVMPPVGKVSRVDHPAAPQGPLQKKLTPSNPQPIPARKSVANLMPVEPEPSNDEMFGELLSGLTDLEESSAIAPELSPEPEGGGKTPANEGDAIQAALQKYAGKPEELAKALIHAQTRMSQKENDLNAMVKAMNAPGNTPTTTTPAQPVAQPPVMSQVTLNPWNKDAFGEKFMDKPGEGAEEIMLRGQEYTKQVFAPLYGEALENKMWRENPDVVNKDSWPLIKALYMSTPGENDLDRLNKAVDHYRQNYHKMPDVVNRPLEVTPVGGSSTAAAASAT